MPVNNKIDESYKSYVPYYNVGDILDATHSLVDADGPCDLFCLAVELPTDQVLRVALLMNHECDAADRISLTDGKFQLELELWRADFSKKLYFCVDLSLRQTIKLAKMKNPAMGYVPIGNPKITVGAQKIFTQKDIQKLLSVKMQFDSLPPKKRPPKWGIG